MLLLSKQRIEPSLELASAARARLSRYPWRRWKLTRSSKSTAEWPCAAICRLQLKPGLIASGLSTLSAVIGLGSRSLTDMAFPSQPFAASLSEGELRRRAGPE